MMPTELLATTAGLAVLSLITLVSAISALRRRRLVSASTRLGISALTLSMFALGGAVLFGTYGYQALTREQVAAVVQTRPVGPQEFEARFSFPDGSKARYTLTGDELYVDSRILKWKSYANLLGLHTAYELDRVAGRYTELGDEQSKTRTVHSLAPARAVDVFNLRQRYEALSFLVDAQYGSATFITADEPAAFEVRVSTTGLLLRRIEP